MKKNILITTIILITVAIVLLFVRNSNKKDATEGIVQEETAKEEMTQEEIIISESVDFTVESNTDSEDMVTEDLMDSGNTEEDPFAYMDEEFPTATLVNEKALCDATGMEEYAALCLPYYLDEHIVDTDVIELRQLTIEYIEGSFVETDLVYIMRIKLKEEPNYYYDCCFSKEGRYWIFALEFIEHLPEDLDNYGSTLPFEFEYDESLLEDMDRTNVGAEVITEEQFLSGDY